jgi:hypothetical protein
MTPNIISQRPNEDDLSLTYVRYLPGWSWQEHHETVNELTVSNNAAQVNIPSPVFSYTIVDWRGTRLPFKGSISAQYRPIPENVCIIILTDDSFTLNMLQIGIKLRKSGNQYKICRTMAEAEKVLNVHRAEHQQVAVSLAAWVATFESTVIPIAS